MNEATLTRVLDLDEMLYPQYWYNFLTITKEEFKILQIKACDLIKQDIEAEYKAAEEVRRHWQSVVSGKVPFGYTIEDQKRRTK